MEKEMRNWWKCSNCGYTLQAPIPPEVCPSCGEKCIFIAARGLPQLWGEMHLHRCNLLHPRVWRTRQHRSPDRPEVVASRTDE
jgi:rubredoxin